MQKIFWLYFFVFFPLLAKESTDFLETIYYSLNPKSFSENLHFYKLYPEATLGKKAYTRAIKLLTQGKPLPTSFAFPKLDVSILVSMVQKKPLEDIPTLSKDILSCLEILASDLQNRNLQGFNIWTKKELLALQPEEIDLARALFLAEFDYNPEKKNTICYYEATIDLMALQIQANLSKSPTDKEKIRKINDFIFHEMQFRFPPQSMHEKHIDTYTFLPSVIDKRKGVCLGVSLLYQCIAQRLGLRLESITPPGHIYLRHVQNEKTINIETTARGIDIPTEKYLGLETLSLQKRTIKELIGLAFMNQASVYWQEQDYKKSLNLYKKALEFMEKDTLLQELYAFNLLFIGKMEKGNNLLHSLKDRPLQYFISEKSLVEDYVHNKIDAEGIKILFTHTEDTRSSILEKQEKLKKVIMQYPGFRAGLLQLASSYLQLLEEKKALQILQQYYALYPKEVIINYYLSTLFFNRWNYKKAWAHFNHLEKSLQKYKLNPKPLQNYKKNLMKKSPLFFDSPNKLDQQIVKTK